jgi:hypothetical protein
VQDLSLDLPEIGFSLARENAGNGSMFASLDDLINILHGPVESSCQSNCQTALTSRHESDEIDLIDRHVSGEF